jgi:hypothetical protein
MKTRLLLALAAISFAVGVLSVGAAPKKAQAATNLQVLKGKSDDEVFQIMQTWSAQLGVTCTVCHVSGDFANDDKGQKATARKMYGVVSALNDMDFFKNNARKADCYLCHKGNQRPAKTPVG